MHALRLLMCTPFLSDFADSAFVPGPQTVLGEEGDAAETTAFVPGTYSFRAGEHCTLCISADFADCIG